MIAGSSLLARNGVGPNLGDSPNYWASPNIESWELLRKAAARLPHSKLRLCNARGGSSKNEKISGDKLSNSRKFEFLGFLLRGHHAGDLHLNGFGGHRFGDVAIHSGYLTTVAIFLEGVGGQSHDGHVPSG